MEIKAGVFSRLVYELRDLPQFICNIQSVFTVAFWNRLFSWVFFFLWHKVQGKTYCASQDKCLSFQKRHYFTRCCWFMDLLHFSHFFFKDNIPCTYFLMANFLPGTCLIRDKQLHQIQSTPVITYCQGTRKYGTL